MKIRHIILLITTLVSGLQVEGQSLWKKFYDGWLIKPRNVDSTYIYQQSMGFTPSLTSNFSRQSVKMTTTLEIEDFPVLDASFNPVLDENGNATYADILIASIDRLEESPSRRAGVILGLGRLGAGWSFEISPDSSQKSSSFLFSFRGNKFGLNINYLSFRQKLIEEFYSDPSSPLFDNHYESTTGNRVRRLTMDGYFIINTRRFAYPPGIAGNMVQLKSAGSWMLAARYLQSTIDMNPDYAIAGFGMLQVSLGCGYSYTWVPWSRHPHPNGKGMCTFFINGTLIPMLTVVNFLSVKPYNDLDGLINTDEKNSLCWPTPNILANATVGFSWSKFYLGAQFNYNVFHFNTRNAISSTGTLQESGIETMGVLYEWNLGLKLQACF